MCLGNVSSVVQCIMNLKVELLELTSLIATCFRKWREDGLNLKLRRTVTTCIRGLQQSMCVGMCLV